MEEGELLADGGVLGTLHEGLEEVTCKLTEVAQGKLGLASFGLHIFARDLEGGWTGLLVDPLDDGVLGTSTSIFLLGSLAISKNDSCQFYSNLDSDSKSDYPDTERSVKI